MTGNLGETRLHRRKRKGDPMRLFDQLPRELRVWMTTAALPWSPQSCAKIWHKARRDGLSPSQAVARLKQSELRSLARDGLQIQTRTWAGQVAHAQPPDQGQPA